VTIQKLSLSYQCPSEELAMAGSSVCCLYLSLPNSRDTSTKKNGIKIRSMNVAESSPPVTAVPIAFWAAAPAPRVKASGKVPKKKAS
jgi:hypothetical protein